MQDAIEAAHKALSTWEQTPTGAKRAILLKAADLLFSEKYKSAIIESLMEETATSEAWAATNLLGGQNNLREAASLASQVKGETFASTSIPGGEVVVRRRPYGAMYVLERYFWCLPILKFCRFASSPWNAPITLTARAVAIPLICGNTVVFKCSEQCPRTQAIFAEILHEVCNLQRPM